MLDYLYSKYQKFLISLFYRHSLVIDPNHNLNGFLDNYEEFYNWVRKTIGLNSIKTTIYAEKNLTSGKKRITKMILHFRKKKDATLVKIRWC